MNAPKYRLTRQQKRQALRDFEKAFNFNDERQFMEAMRKIGIKDEDPRFLRGLKAFRDLKSGKKREQTHFDESA